jgi:alpha-1,6-mannosyltransferase
VILGTCVGYNYGLTWLVRAVLGLLNGVALILFGRSVQRAFGASAGIWYALLQASQFHVIYYASRTLPNMYAFVFSKLHIVSHWRLSDSNVKVPLH